MLSGSNWTQPECGYERDETRGCYHRIEMKPQTIGRVLGIGLRVAGRVAGERLNAAGTPAQPSAQTSAPPQQVHARGVAAGKAVRNAPRGIGGFLRPCRRVGGIVFLEVMGVFFLVFVLVFGQMLWRAHDSYRAGPDHQKFLLAAGLVLVFLYLGVSSFWRARRK